MWDPISIFFCIWVLNIGLPDGRLKALEVIDAKEQTIINQAIIDSTDLRTGINE